MELPKRWIVRVLHIQMETSDMSAKFKKQWGYMVSPTRFPGIFQMKEGGFVARARIQDPAGHQVLIFRVLREVETAKAALDWLDAEKTMVRMGSHGPAPKLFSVFAADLLERKLSRREIRSAAGESKWRVSLAHLVGGTRKAGHVIQGLGDIGAMDLRAHHVERWKDAIAPLITEGHYSPVTVNGWLTTLRTVSKAISHEYETRDFMLGVQDFSTKDHHTYTEEEPNSLPPDRVPDFLALLRRRWPQHYAFVYLGFITGLRPSTIRPLRRRGPEADIVWDQGRLLVRRSEVNGRVLETTKTGIRYSVHLPQEVLDVLRWHVEHLTPVQERSDLLFPSDIGGFRAGSCLKKPFQDVVDALGLGFKLTPRGMRRSFQDLARAAQVQDLVTRSVSGHATEQMQRHYSTVHPEEQRASLSRVLRVIEGGRSDRVVSEVVSADAEVVRSSGA